jgi:hypothetical protein
MALVKKVRFSLQIAQVKYYYPRLELLSSADVVFIGTILVKCIMEL